MFRHCSAVLVAAATALTVSAAQSDVFNMPNGEASVQFVPVGNSGNVADSTGYGAVAYTYAMGKYDVTVGQYCQFLNAVAVTDTYGLYNSYMSNGGGYYSTVGIIRSGSPGSYTYSVSYNSTAWSSYATYDFSLFPSAQVASNDAPVFDVSWGDAARFCNWLKNGQPSNLGEAAGSTETGSYTLDGATTDSQLMTVTRNTGATYFIPSENEWYKAAYYNPSNGTYWTYETQSNTAPSNQLSTTGANNANYHVNVSSYTDPTNCLTPVGAFASSPGPYGTFDMGGDLYQWNEANVSNQYRGLWGGEWAVAAEDLASSNIASDNPSDENTVIGFRVASVPGGWHDPGDANEDGRVDVNDLTIVLSSFGQTGMNWTQGDFNGDAKVDINDLTIVLSNFGQTAGTAPIGAVPEPGVLALLAAGLIAILAYTWRRRK